MAKITVHYHKFAQRPTAMELTLAREEYVNVSTFTEEVDDEALAAFWQALSRVTGNEMPGYVKGTAISINIDTFVQLLQKLGMSPLHYYLRALGMADWISTFQAAHSAFCKDTRQFYFVRLDGSE